MTTIEIYNILKQIDADVMVNMALYLSEDFSSRLLTPIDQILDLSKEYEYKCTKSPKFCLGFALAYSYRNLYKNVMEHPNEKPNHKLETYPDYDRVIMDDCFREYIRRRTLLIHKKQFADQGFSQEIHQKCYEILYGELKEELQWAIEELSCEGKKNIIMLVRRLKLFVEMEVPMQDSDSSKLVSQKLCEKPKLDESTLEEDNFEDLKKIVPSGKWGDIETIKEELGLHIDTCPDATKRTKKMQKEGKIEIDAEKRELYKVIEKVYGPLNFTFDTFRKGMERKL